MSNLLLPGGNPAALIERAKSHVLEPGMQGLAKEFGVSRGNALAFIVAGAAQIMHGHSATKTHDFLKALADVVAAGEGLGRDAAMARLNTSLQNFLDGVGGM